MYSEDYKRRAVEYKQEGHSFKDLKAVFKMPNQTYCRWAEEYKNNFAPKPRAEYTRKIDKAQLLNNVINLRQQRFNKDVYESWRTFQPPPLWF